MLVAIVALALALAIVFGGTPVAAEEATAPEAVKPAEAVEAPEAVKPDVPEPKAMAKGEYVIVVSAATNADEGWKKVVECLVQKHNGTAFEYDKSPAETRAELIETRPRYIAFVVRPTEIACAKGHIIPNAYTKLINQFTRTLDDDPYTDAIWGIITGYDAADALKVAELKAIRSKFGAGMGGPSNSIEAGWGYNGNVSGVRWNKEKGKDQVETKGHPADSTKELVDLLNENKVDMWWAGGHATEADWQLEFRVKNGQFRTFGGQVFGLPMGGGRLPIKTTNPKIFCPTGNCLIANINDPNNCMALSWIRNGAHQFVGYTVATWYGWYNGLERWVRGLQGQVTVGEAFFLHSQGLMWNLQAKRVAGQDANGHMHDCDGAVFYGDPAADARIAKCIDPLYEQTLKIEPAPDDAASVKVTFTVKVMQKCGFSFRTPIAALYPYRLKNIKPGEANVQNILATDDFVMFLPPDGEYEPGTTWQVTFLAQKM